MADPVGLSAAGLVAGLCALGYSYPNIKYYTKKEVFAAFRVVKRGRNWTKNGILGVIWRRRAERGAKPTRGTRGPRVVTAAREVIAPYRRLGLSCCAAGFACAEGVRLADERSEELCEAKSQEPERRNPLWPTRRPALPYSKTPRSESNSV